MEIEVRQSDVSYRSEQGAAINCEECSGNRRMIGVPEAIRHTGVSSRQIHRFVEAGRLHFLETRTGALVVCVDSLEALIAEET